MTIGGTPIAFERASAPTRVGERVELDRGSFVEAYDFTPRSIEQTFVFASSPGTGELVVHIPLAGFAVGTPIGVRPRYFRVATNGVRDSLPNSASIRITFQGAPDDGSGAPNTTFASAWTANVNALESLPGLAFVRFQVDFDLAADGSELNAGSPRPSLEFLRIPFIR